MWSAEWQKTNHWVPFQPGHTEIVAIGWIINLVAVAANVLVFIAAIRIDERLYILLILNLCDSFFGWFNIATLEIQSSIIAPINFHPIYHADTIN
jgi:hypothetical protein